MIARMFYVQCDGCGRPCGGGLQLRDTTPQARAVARRCGWLRIPRLSNNHPDGPQDGRDYCPACRTTREATS